MRGKMTRAEFSPRSSFVGHSMPGRSRRIFSQRNFIEKRAARVTIRTQNQNMATSTAPTGLPVIRAAGGIVLRSAPRGEEVMVVYRKRHKDWTLPKGKLKDGESFQDAAIREVVEETGCSCNLG